MSTYDDAAINRAVRELHEWECSFGADGKACTRGPDSHSPSYHGYVEKVFDSLERAPWWREVTDPDEVIPAGCPVRCERAGGIVTEYAAYEPHPPLRVPDRSTRVFVDTRWQSESEPFKVGDAIETVEDAERFTRLKYGKAALVDYWGHVWTLTGRDRFNFGQTVCNHVELLDNYGPLTVIYVPAVDG